MFVFYVVLVRIRVGVGIYTMRTSYCGRVRLLRLLLCVVEIDLRVLHARKATRSLEF